MIIKEEGASEIINNEVKMTKVEVERDESDENTNEEVPSYKDAVISSATSNGTPTPILRSPRRTTPGRTSKHKLNNGARRTASDRYDLRSNPNPSQKLKDAKSNSNVQYMFLQLQEHPTLRNRMQVHKYLTNFILPSQVKYMIK